MISLSTLNMPIVDLVSLSSKSEKVSHEFFEKSLGIPIPDPSRFLKKDHINSLF